ncbi:hydroxymethylglutaryl-CoA synthase [Qaidamihabitans albus]|uniref:hydroxymethylglutaryl-CoA synthase n=1 Tax=Qaidamihabitans albus TaxID=2795733 RepID=UPI0018F1BB5A|nr:hydroxymethylglutaryl-CoA synthase [Qaidamihabitans albus]
MTHKLLAYATYRPHYTLPRSVVNAALTGVARGSGERTVAGYDEDAVSMAVAATRRLGAGVRSADQLYFGTATSPLLDKSCSLIVHAASSMHDRAFTLDVTGLRAGFGVLKSASTTGGVAAMADMRTGRPGSAVELEGGDGAAAFLFGEGADAVAEVLGSASVPMEVMDAWRVPGTSHALVGEDRFVDHALGRAVREVVSEVAKATGQTDPPTTSVVSTLNRRLAGALAASIRPDGFTDVQAVHRETTGYCGAADIGLLLADALDAAVAGDTVLAVSAGGGADALLLRALKDGPLAGVGGAGRRRPPGEAIGYYQYLTWRGEIGREPARRPARPSVAPPPSFRDSDWKFGLVGSECLECGKVYLPPQRVCRCGAVDEVRPFPVADLTGTVVAHTTDGVSDSPNPPSLAALVDFGTTGRLLLEVADARPSEITDGTEVEMTFRRTYAVDGVPNYFWKARPKNRSSK